MTRDTTHSERRLTRTQRAIVSLAAVVCIVLAGATLVTAQQQTFSDDFEDGDVDGWESPEGEVPEISETSTEGDYSMLARSEQLSNQPQPAMLWQQGPVLDMSEDFTVEMMVQPDHRGNDFTIRIGIPGSDQTEEGENAFIIFNEPSGETYLSTHATQTSPGSGQTISDSFDEQWVHVTLSSQAGSGELNATVSPVGSQTEHELSADGFEGISGQFAVNPGFSPDHPRSVYLDSVELVGEEVEDSEDLRLDVPGYLQHNASSSYAVEANQSGTWTDVTDDATVTPSNTDALTFYPSNNTVVAGGNKSINERVNVTAMHDGLNATDYTVVATPTVDNLDLLPAWWSVNAVLSDWTMIWILLSTLIATAATRMATTFAGIGAFAMAMIMGWIMGDVPDGIMVATIFMALFIGLNLAANIDYSVR